jgi:hypothetical protein
MPSKRANAKQKTTSRMFGEALGWIVAWAWTILAAGGGLRLLWTKGPWPLTNGWFALFSGVSACPATGWLLRKYAGVTVSGYVRLAAASLFFVAGKIALAFGI